MPKRTLALIGILILIAAALVAIAVSPKNQSLPAITITPPLKPSTAAVAQTALSMSPNSVTVAQGATGSVTINVDTGDNAITAVQLEISFDPKALGNVTVTAGSYFQNSFELLKSIDNKTGKISYALGLPPTAIAKKGVGAVATITFTSFLSAGQSTQFVFSEKSLVTAEGVSKSVLKSSSGATITGDQATTP